MIKLTLLQISPALAKLRQAMVRGLDSYLSSEDNSEFVPSDSGADASYQTDSEAEETDQSALPQDQGLMSPKAGPPLKFPTGRAWRLEWEDGHHAHTQSVAVLMSQLITVVSPKRHGRMKAKLVPSHDHL